MSNWVDTWWCRLLRQRFGRRSFKFWNEKSRSHTEYVKLETSVIHPSGDDKWIMRYLLLVEVQRRRLGRIRNLGVISIKIFKSMGVDEFAKRNTVEERKRWGRGEAQNQALRIPII